VLSRVTPPRDGHPPSNDGSVSFASVQIEREPNPPKGGREQVLQYGGDKPLRNVRAFQEAAATLELTVSCMSHS